jgi:hypothetical protein
LNTFLQIWKVSGKTVAVGVKAMTGVKVGVRVGVMVGVLVCV